MVLDSAESVLEFKLEEAEARSIRCMPTCRAREGRHGTWQVNEIQSAGRDKESGELCGVNDSVCMSGSDTSQQQGGQLV